MNISFTRPLSLAWARMVRQLFRPFRFEAWLVLGFSAFLARIFSHGGSIASWNGGPVHGGLSSAAAEQGLEAVRDQLVRLLEHPAVLIAIATGLVVVGVVVLVLAYVSARSQFVFLDCVMNRRAEFVGPWERYGRQGRSLFLWNAVFSFAWLIPLAAVLVPCLSLLHALFTGGDIILPGLGLLIIGCLVALVFALVIGFVQVLLREFVVPLMWRYDETTTQAWARFWPHLTAHFADFIAYAVFVLVLWIGVGIAVVAAGIATCCIGLVLIAIPYVGSVVLLPVHVTGRALGPEFLAQYGPEWNVVPPLPAEE